VPVDDALDFRYAFEDGEVSDLVVRVVVNALGKVRVKDLKFGGVSRIPTPARDPCLAETLLAPDKVSLRKGGRGGCHIAINDPSFSCHFVVRRE